MNKCIDVALGLLRQADNVLITQRSTRVDLPGLWEFPGGKQQGAESIRQTLFRELNEELNIQVNDAQLVLSLWHQYPHANVLLHVFTVNEFSGSACGAEGQPVRWVGENELPDYNFPAANDAILALFRAGLL